MCLRNSILLLWCLFLAYGEARSGDAKEQEKLEGTWSFVSSSGEASQKKEKLGRRADGLQRRHGVLCGRG